MSTNIRVNADLGGIRKRLLEQQQAQRLAYLEQVRREDTEQQALDARASRDQKLRRQFPAPLSKQALNRRRYRPDELAAFRQGRCPPLNSAWNDSAYRVVFEPRGTIPVDDAESVQLRFCFQYYKYRLLNLSSWTYGSEIELWDGYGTGDPADPNSIIGPPGSEPFSAGVYTNPLFNFGWNLFGSVLVSDLPDVMSGYAAFYAGPPPLTGIESEPQLLVKAGSGATVTQPGAYRLGFSYFNGFTTTFNTYHLAPLGVSGSDEWRYAITDYDPIIVEFRPVNQQAAVTKAACYFGANRLEPPP